MSLDTVLLGRILFGALLGFAVGLERWVRGSTAGERTFALVAMGAATFTAVGVERFPATAEKLIAGVVTGIGFLGAGLIMKGDGGVVRGLTTAASLWAMAATGVLAGAGEFLLGIAASLLMVLILELEYLPGFERVLQAARRRWSHTDSDDSRS